MAANDNESPEGAVFNDRGRKRALRVAMGVIGASWAGAFSYGLVPGWSGGVLPGLIVGFSLLQEPANDNEK